MQFVTLRQNTQALKSAQEQHFYSSLTSKEETVYFWGSDFVMWVFTHHIHLQASNRNINLPFKTALDRGKSASGR